MYFLFVCWWKLIAVVIFILFYLQIQEENYVSCAIGWRTTKQIFDRGIIDMDWNMKYFNLVISFDFFVTNPSVYFSPALENL